MGSGSLNDRLTSGAIRANVNWRGGIFAFGVVPVGAMVTVVVRLYRSGSGRSMAFGTGGGAAAFVLPLAVVVSVLTHPAAIKVRTATAPARNNNLHLIPLMLYRIDILLR